MIRHVLVAAAVLAVRGAARAEALPPPPAPESHGRLVPGQTLRLEAPRAGPPLLRVVPAQGAVYLEQPAWTWLLDARRYAEVRAEAALEIAHRERWRAFTAGVSAGFAVGSGAWAATSDATAAARWTAAGAAAAAALVSIAVLAR